MTFDPTTDPALRSWVPCQPGGDFPIQNLPFGAFTRDRGQRRLGVAIGSAVLDLRLAAEAGLYDDALADARAILSAPVLNPLLAAGREAWRSVRAKTSALLSAGDATLRDAGLQEAALLPLRGTALHLPLEVADYVDFYSSLEHATNLGKIMRPGGEALLPNWRYIPIGYHGRAATIVPSGTPIVRPRGQLRPGDGAPVYAPTRALDFELELAFITGDGPAPPGRIQPDRARDYIFGVALMNDWSARDIQAWEYQPLGPFLGKSFATSLSPWIVTLDALEPFRVAGPIQTPPALAHLATAGAEGYDIALEALLSSQAMRERGTADYVVTRTNFRAMYWSMAQQLAHVASNGAAVRCGDLYGSGTISGSEPGSFGSLIETTWRGAHPLALPDGSSRSFLDDGDEVVLRGWSAPHDGVRIGFGECRGTVRSTA